MADYKAPLNNMQFLLADVFKLPNLWSSMSSLADVDVDTAKAILEEVARLAQEELAPLNREADEEGSHWRDGDVVAPRGFKDAYKLFCDGGWGSLSGNPEFDGMGMPKTLVAMADECVQGACMVVWASANANRRRRSGTRYTRFNRAEVVLSAKNV